MDYKNDVLEEHDSRVDHAFANKEMLSLAEACRYMGISKSTMYKMTSQRKISHFSPGGKLIYLKRTELDAWMQKNRRSTEEEIDEKVSSVRL